MRVTFPHIDIPVVEKSRKKDSVLDFRSITLDDIDMLRDYLAEFKSESCDYSIGGILMWTRYFHYELAEKAGFLFMKGDSPVDGSPLFSLPLGGDISKGLETVREYCDAEGIDAKVMLPVVNLADAGFDSESGDELKGWSDYVYDIDKFIGFPGKKLQQKRNHLNYFRNNFGDAEIKEITLDDKDDLVEFAVEFGTGHDTDEMSVYETEETISLIENLESYPMKGIVVRYAGKVIGFTIGEVIGDMLFAHVEKGNTDYRGIYQLLASELCKLAKSYYPDLKWVNREEDVDNESLRQSKLSYRPDHMIEKRIVRLD